MKTKKKFLLDLFKYFTVERFDLNKRSFKILAGKWAKFDYEKKYNFLNEILKK